MNSTDVAVRENGQQQTVLSNDQLQYIAKTEFVPPGLRGNLPAILACVATGRALGIADMTALRSIHIIDGKATFSAELMVQLVRRQGHSITGEVTDGAATVNGTRADNGDTMKMTWTLAMADRAGLLGKSNWKKYPASMLWARAASQLCRMLFADCFAGATYTPEELDETEMLSAEDPPLEDDGLFPPRVELPPAAPASGSLLEPAEPGEVAGVGNEPVVGAADELPSGFPIPTSVGVAVATKAQQTLIVMKATEAGLDDDARHALISAVTGQPSSKAVPKALVDAVLAEIAKVPVGARAATEQAEAKA